MRANKRTATVSSLVLLYGLACPSLGAAQGRDSLRDGALEGLAAGVLAGAVLTFTGAGGPLSKPYCENEATGTNCTARAFVGTVLFGGVGAGIGALIDSARSSRVNRPLRERPLDVAPIVGRSRKGMAVRLKF